MQYCRGGKKSKLFSPGSDFTEQIFTRKLSRVDSAGVLRQGVFTKTLNSFFIKRGAGKFFLKLDEFDEFNE